jgi:hypothetical protein
MPARFIDSCMSPRAAAPSPHQPIATRSSRRSWNASAIPVMTGIIAGRWLTPARRPFPGPKSLERRFESRPRVAPPPRPMNWQKIAAGGMPRTRWTPRFR